MDSGRFVALIFKYGIIGSILTTPILANNIRYIEIYHPSNYLQISSLAVYDYYTGINIAINKSTIASDTYNTGVVVGNNCRYKDIYAVDGILIPKYFDNCALYHAYYSASSSNSFWRLDLGKDESIQRIVYYNRGDCCQNRAVGAILKAYDSSNNLVAWWLLTSELIQTLYPPT
eukprot:gene5931-11965_t